MAPLCTVLLMVPPLSSLAFVLKTGTVANALHQFGPGPAARLIYPCTSCAYIEPMEHIEQVLGPDFNKQEDEEMNTTTAIRAERATSTTM